MRRVLISCAIVFVITSLFSLPINSQIELLEFDDEEEFEKTPRREVLILPKPQKKKLDVEDLMHSGDIVDVDVLGSVEYDWRGEISNEGYLTGVNFLEKEIYASCRTEESIAKEIADGYGKLLNKPKVVVRILDRSRRPASSLYGAVSLPQRYKLKRKVFLNELIILSGGLTDRASGEIQILRQPKTNCVLKEPPGDEIRLGDTSAKAEFVKVGTRNELKMITIKVSDLLKGKKGANPRIRYGDLINVMIAQPVYVIGAVGNPTKLSIRKGLTVSRAIDSAGGLGRDAKPDRITIYRRVDRKVELIKIDLGKINRQDERDIELRPFDIVRVPGSGNEDDGVPPIIRLEFNDKKDISKLPLRVVD